MAARKGGMPTPLGRVMTAMVTPMDDELKVDLDSAQRVADYLLNNGTDSIVVCGTTGESPTLSDQERVDIVKAVKEVADGRGKVIAGSGCNSTWESVKITKDVTAAGADAAMVVVPYYNKPPQEGIYRHFKEVAAATDLPIIAYNVPSRTSVNMTSETVIRLAFDVENIIAVKEAAGDLSQASRMIAGTSDDFYFFSGEDDLNLPYLSLGANGFISVTAHTVGPQLAEMVDKFSKGDTAAAQRIHEEISPMTKAMFATTNPILPKAAMKLLGIPVGGLRPPMIEATEEQVESLRQTMESMGLL